MDNLQPGQELGPYRLIEQIGQGGMAAVYKAYHAAMDRFVALKVLPRNLADSPEFIGRFRQEARTIANLEHAHILPVHDYGESGGTTYMVMRYLDAGTLKDRIASSPLSLADVDRYFSQLADALDYAHAHGVVHRDLKPSNVLVDNRDNAFLTDFGIAKLLESTAHFTTTGGLIGTPAYMSPEQAEGRPVDQRSDIYSLGIILYEMATGRVPYEAETPLAVVLKHLKDPLPLPSSVKPGLSPDIERVLLKALSKNPDDRFSNMAEFLKAWKEAYGTATSTTPTMAGQRAPEPAPATLAAAPAPAAPAVAPAAPAPAVAAVPKRGGPSLGLALGLGALVVIVIVGSLLAVRFIRKRAAANRAAETPPSATSAVALGGTPAPGNPGWTSWTAANNVETVLVNGDQVLTAGWGGITIWNRADGSIVRRYTTADGLPHPHVTSMFVDPDTGELWVGTDNGLARFDGDTWTIYTDQDGLDSSTVSGITRWGGKLVVTTGYGPPGGGVNQFDGQAWKPMPDFPSAYEGEGGKLSNNTTTILADPSGDLWVGTLAGLGRYDGQAWTRFSTDDGLPSNIVYSLFLDDQGELWVGTISGAAKFAGEKFEPIQQGPGYDVYGIAQDLDGRYWFSGSGGVWRFDPARVDWQEFSEGTGDMPSYTMYRIAMDTDGNLYFGSDGSGVVRYDGQEFDVWRMPNSPTLAGVGAIVHPPGENELWFVQEYGGRVDVFDLGFEEWSPLPESECECWPLFFGRDGTMYGARWNQFWIVTKDEATNVSEAEGWPTEAGVLTAALAPDGTVWIATERGLVHFDGLRVTQVLTAADTGFASDEIHSLLMASDGSLWVGLHQGLSRLTPDGVWENYGQSDPFDESLTYVKDIAEDPSGAIWLATYDAGAYRFADGHWENFTASQPGVNLPTDSLTSVTAAPDGSVWFGGYDRGAARFDGKEWQVFRVSDGLIDGSVNDIYVLDTGAVWFATGGGVSRYVP